MSQAENNVDKLKELLLHWCRERPVRLCVLFGSQATGGAHPGSDVDLALWPDQPLSSAEKLRWVRELTDLLDKEVSLVLVSPDLDPVLGFEIVRDGFLAFESEPELWIKERTRLWHAYDDSLPFRRAALKQIKEYSKEVYHGT